jgi:hypothetical protein
MGMAVASGDRFVTMRSDQPQLAWWDREGVRQVVRWNPPRVQPRQEHLDVFADRIREETPKLNPGRGGPEMDRMIERQIASFQIDPSQPLPVLGHVFGDHVGGVWLSDFSIEGIIYGGSKWSVISPAGEWLGRVALPQRFRLLDVRGDRVAGVLTDDLDVESVAVFSLVAAK